ncbi:MAG: hypothetical protein ABI779_05145 [Acidobacteriota bacterium]
MTAEGVRARWETLWARLDAEAEAERLSEAAFFNLSKAYRYLLPDERVIVDHVLEEWVLSSDERKQFDALGLIREHRITSAAPALHELAARLAKSPDQRSQHELKDIQRILTKLEDGDRS